MTNAVLAIEGLTVDLPAGADRPHAVEELDLTVGRNEILCIVGEIRFRQVGHRAGGAWAAAEGAASDRRRGHHLRRNGPGVGARVATAPAARCAHRHDLSGTDGCAQPGDDTSATRSPKRSVRMSVSRRSRCVSASRRCWRRSGLPDPSLLRRAHPHNLSGGQRQRVMIAMALALATRPADRRRADHRARCHHADADPAPAERRSSSNADGHAVHHA